MSSAEITLGSDLFLKAIENGLDKTIGKKPEEYTELQLSLREMSRWLLRNNAIYKNGGDWKLNEVGIANISDENAKGFVPYYVNALRAFDMHSSKLIRDRKKKFVDAFRETHEIEGFQVVSETITRVRGDDLQKIAGLALNLLEVTQNDPANTVFVPGLTSAGLQTVWNVMEESGYLMPGENPDRQKPIGEQKLRGTPEEQDALFFAVSALSSNIDVPETIQGGNAPALAAKMLKLAVNGAHTEEIEVDKITGLALESGHDSDLTNEDANTIFNVINTSLRMIHTAEWNPEDLQTLLADPNLLDDVRVSLDKYYGDSIDACLKSGNMGDPKISPQLAERMGRAIDFLNEAIGNNLKDEVIRADEGGYALHDDEDPEVDPEDLEDVGVDEIQYSNPFEGRKAPAAGLRAGRQDGKKTQKQIEAEQRARQVELEQGAERASARLSQAESIADARFFGKIGDDGRIWVSEPMIFEFDSLSMELLHTGVVEYLGQRAGRANTPIGDIASSKAAFGTIEDAMGSFRAGLEGSSHTTSAGMGRVITRQEKHYLNPKKLAKLRTAKVLEHNEEMKEGDLFYGYRPGSPETAGKRMTRYIDDHMVTKTGAPNYKLRRFLSDALEMPVECTYRGEGEAVIAYAEKVQARDREERELRKKMSREGAGLSSVDFPTKDIMRMVKVIEASEADPVVRVSLDAHGNVTLSNEDAPRVSAKAGVLSDTIRDADKIRRQLGGNISAEQLKAAVQTGADNVSILISGEAPYGVIGKTENFGALENTRAAKKKADASRDLAFS